jgi:phosphopentomutase
MVLVKRVFLIVLDGAGVGELPDASLYGDQGSNTLGNLAQAVGGLKLPSLEAAGLGRLTAIEGVSGNLPGGIFGKMAELSAGKDTTTGHWEMAGLILERPFPTFPQGFPAKLINEFSLLTGKGLLGNKAASGTLIIEELGAEHLRTGSPIVYTSADSVFQIAAHEEVIPLSELYRLCEIARGLLQGEWGVGRVIARPFTVQTHRRAEGLFTKTFCPKCFGPDESRRVNGLWRRKARRYLCPAGIDRLQSYTQ